MITKCNSICWIDSTLLKLTLFWSLSFLFSILFILHRLRSLSKTLDFQSFSSFQKLGQLVLKLINIKNRKILVNKTWPYMEWNLALKLTWATLTSPAYMNSRIAVRCWNGTSLRMMMGCLAGFSSNRALKYGEQAERIILWALQLWPSQARVTSQNDFSSLRCLNDATMLVWKSFHLRQNCCWSSIFLDCFSFLKRSNISNSFYNIKIFQI